MTYTPCPAEYNGWPCAYEAGHPGLHLNRGAPNGPGSYLRWGDWARPHHQTDPAA